MQWPTIQQRIQDGESGRVEFNRGLGDLSAIGLAICAFANTDGGVVILGIESSGEIVGVKEGTERVQERLTSFLQTGCSAPVSASIGRQDTPSGWVHWLEVSRQRGFEPMRFDGRVWLRRGRSSVEPSATELQELYNTFGYVLTEQRAIQDAVPDHIDLSAFFAYLRRLGASLARRDRECWRILPPASEKLGSVVKMDASQER